MENWRNIFIVVQLFSWELGVVRFGVRNVGLSVGLLSNKVEDDSELVRVGTHSYVKGAQCGNRTSWVGGIIKKPTHCVGVW